MIAAVWHALVDPLVRHNVAEIGRVRNWVGDIAGAASADANNPFATIAPTIRMLFAKS